MDKELIRITNLSKKYKTQIVFEGVSASFERGKIHGIIGRNGSGKTVLLKCLCGFIPHDSGEIVINGKILGKTIEMPESYGAIIENPSFLPRYSALKNLKFLAGLKGKVSQKDILDVLKKVGLEKEASKRVSKYSLGMRQRLGIAQAIMENPQLLILDEPLSGLDRVGLAEMRNLFLNYKVHGKTILLASHSTEDIETLCDTVWEIESGNLKRHR